MKKLLLCILFFISNQIQTMQKVSHFVNFYVANMVKNAVNPSKFSFSGNQNNTQSQILNDQVAQNIQHENLEKNSLPKTPLCHAILHQNQAKIKSLLQEGTHLQEKSSEHPFSDGWSPLHAAVVTGDHDLMQTLLRHGANINDRSQIAQVSPLHLAIVAHDINAIEVLIAYKANIDIQSMNGWTPLHCAVSHGNLKIIQFLLQAGADTTIKNNEGKTPLDTASPKNYENISKLFKEHSDHKS